MITNIDQSYVSTIHISKQNESKMIDTYATFVSSNIQM